MPTLEELRGQRVQLLDETEEMLQKDELTPDEEALCEANLEEVETLKEQIERKERQLNRIKKVDTEKTELRDKAKRLSTTSTLQADIMRDPYYAVAKRWTPGNLKAFTDDREAFACGQWFKHLVWGDKFPDTERWLRDYGEQYGVVVRGASLTAGGALAPDPLAAAIINLKETYGLMRRSARRWPMSSDVLTVPRRTGGVTSYYVSETSSITASDPSFDNVKLVAKTLGVLTRVSMEIASDAVIGLADFIASEFATAFAKAEDDAGFGGDGTSTYGGIQGVVSKHLNNIGTYAGQIDTGTDNSFSDLTIAEFAGLIGLVEPQDALMNAAWYITPLGWANSMQRLQFSAGGVTVDQLSGRAPLSFMGYPVNLVQSTAGDALYNTTADNSSGNDVWCLFGDMSRAVALGDRQGITIETDRSRYFEFNQMGIRGIQRYDLVVHDVGDASTAGPVVALVHTP